MDPVAFLSTYLFFCILNHIRPKREDGFENFYSVLDVGSFDVNGNLRDAIKTSTFSEKRNYSYIGVDRAAGPNVDVVYENDWPLENETV